MILFFICAALLVILALALVLPTIAKTHSSIDRQAVNIAIARSQLEDLQKKNADGELQQSEYEDERLRLERDLAGDLSVQEGGLDNSSGRWIVWPVAAFVPIAAGIMYLTVGTPEAIEPMAAMQQPITTADASTPAQTTAAEQPAPDMREMIVRINERLEQQPDDATGWFMLGRAHMAVGEFEAAVVAIRRAQELTGDNPEVMVRLADAIAMTQGGSMAGEPEPLLVKALAMQPNNLQALWLLGIAQDERGDYSAAITTWQKLLPLVADDQRSTQEVNQLISAAQMSLGDGESSLYNGALINVQVQVESALATKMSPDTIVYVYAKASKGPPMPLAVARKTVAELPFTVELTDRDAMMEAMKLSAFDSVVIGARISASGNAIAQPGDLFGEVMDVSTDRSDPVVVTISSVVK